MRAGTKLIIAVMLLLCACGGSGGSGSSPRDASCGGASCGPDDEKPAPPPLSCGSDASCPQGYRCVDDAADRCDPANGDADCGGVCVLGEALPGCGMTQEPCPAGSVCVDDPSDDCDGGPAVDCPGVCRPEATGACAADADCPALPAVCDTCADGSFSCPISRCDDGQCVVESKPCAQPPTCGGITGATCPAGFMCIDDPSDTCDQNGGADCPGLCEPAIPDECSSDADCPQLRAPCSICPDGSEVCPKSWCESGRCNVSFPSCAPAVVCGEDGAGCGPGEVCVSDADNGCDPAIGQNGCTGMCVPIDQPRPCGESGDVCPPGYQCVDPTGTTCDPNTAGEGCAGACVPIAPPQCQDDSECAVIQAPCALCADGTFSCPRSECRNGVCAVVLDACTGPGFCGGVAGFPCPPGQTCIDAPNDECDPTRGGADCEGMCVRDEKPPSCGGIAGAPCPPGYECADDPGDDCDPNAGGSDCAGTCRPGSIPTCSSDADCFIGAPCRICPDGTAICPKAACVNGGCQVEFGTCADAPS